MALYIFIYFLLSTFLYFFPKAGFHKIYQYAVFVQRVHIRRATQSEARWKDRCNLCMWWRKRMSWDEILKQVMCYTGDPLYVTRQFCSSVLWHCWLGCEACKSHPEMTYDVSPGGTLNHARSLAGLRKLWLILVQDTWRQSKKWTLADAELENLPLPTLSQPSCILSPAHLREVSRPITRWIIV